MSALGGANETAVTGYDPDTGKAIVSQTSKRPSDQWKQIISGALTGLAAGGGQTGPGSTLRRFGAGYQAGQQKQDQLAEEKNKFAQQQFENEQRAATEKANRSLLGTQILTNRFKLEQERIKAQDDQINSLNEWEKAVKTAPGAKDKGTFNNIQDAMKAVEDDPMMHDDHAHGFATYHSNIVDGEVKGVRAAIMQPDWFDQLTDQDHDIMVKTGVDKDGKPTYFTHTLPAGSTTNNKWITQTMAQDKAQSDQDLKAAQAKADVDKAQAAVDRATTLTDLNAAHAQLYEAQAELAKYQAGGGVKLSNRAGVLPGETPDSLVESIGTGHMQLDRLGYLAAKNPELLKAVVEKYPDFDNTKVAAYVQTAKEFASTKMTNAGGQMQSAGTALKHLYHLSQLNTKNSIIPGTEDYKRYQTQLNVLADELAKFYGTNTKEAREKFSGNLDSIFPGNRTAAMQEQAHAMGEKLDSLEQQWNQAAPSAAYRPKMPQIDDLAKTARAYFDPRYHQRFGAELEQRRSGQQTPQQTGGAGAPPSPPEAPEQQPAAAQPAAGGGKPPTGGNNPPPSGMKVSIAQAKLLPAFKGKTDQQITDAIKQQGHIPVP